MRLRKGSTVKNENQKGSTLDPEDANEEIVESSDSVGQKGLQQHFAPVAVAQLVAALHQRTAVLDPTAGDGSLLCELPKEYRFGIEIDKAQVANGDYHAIQGDLQQVAPLLLPLDTDFGMVALNPPYGLDWDDTSHNARLAAAHLPAKPEISSTLATWIYANDIVSLNGQGLMILGKKRYETEIKPLIESNFYGEFEADRPHVYAEITVPDMWEEVGIEIVVILWTRRYRQGYGQSYTKLPPLQLTASVGDLGMSDFQERLTTYRQHFNSRLESYAYNTRRDVSKFEAVQTEYDIRMERGRKNRNKWDVYNLAGKIRVNLKPYSLMTLQREDRNAFYVVQGVDKSALTYFAMNPKEWTTIVEANDAGWIRVDPRLISRVEDIIATNHKKIVPLYELKPQQRLGYLKDISTIECLKTSADGEFVQGEMYPIVVQTNVTESFEKQRPTVGKDGEVKLKDFVTVRKLLSIRIGKRRYRQRQFHGDRWFEW